MKVAYLVNYYPKVSHTFIRREILALEALGFEVERFAVRRVEVAIVDEADESELQKTRIIVDIGAVKALFATLGLFASSPGRFVDTLALTVRIGIGSERGLLRNLAYFVEACVMHRWLQKSGAQHLHSHFGTNSTAVAMLTHALGGPGYSFTTHGPEEFDKAQQISLRDKLERSRFAVAISSFGRSQLMRNCDYAHWSKVHVVRCGLDDSFLAGSSTPVTDRPRLVNVGRLSGQKGQVLLLEAFAGVVAKRPDAELVLVGDGEMRSEIEAAIVRLGLQKNVRITGWATNAQVREELEQARCLVLPSFAEGLPVVIMEALALGRPVLTTYVAGIPELVSRECGWLVPAGTIEPLLQAMLEVLDASPAELTRLGAEGQKRVRAAHDAVTESTKLGELFKQYAR
jgi:colanic acid/amylovoran biosynthesis glycosyltransferase